MVDDERTPNDSAAMPITVVPDLPPRVLLNGANGPPAADAVVVLNVRAADDHGLAGVHLMVSVNGEAPARTGRSGARIRGQAPRSGPMGVFVEAGRLGAEGARPRGILGRGDGPQRRHRARQGEIAPAVVPGDGWRNPRPLDLQRPRGHAGGPAQAADDQQHSRPPTMRPLDGPGKGAGPPSASIRGKLARTLEDDQPAGGDRSPAARRPGAGPMADAVQLLESGRDAAGTIKQDEFRAQSLPVQDKIIAELEALLSALQRRTNRGARRPEADREEGPRGVQEADRRDRRNDQTPRRAAQGRDANGGQVREAADEEPQRRQGRRGQKSPAIAGRPGQADADLGQGFGGRAAEAGRGLRGRLRRCGRTPTASTRKSRRRRSGPSRRRSRCRRRTSASRWARR